MARHVLLLLFIVATQAQAAERIDLAGKWERWIAGQAHDVVSVPSFVAVEGSVKFRRTIEIPPVKPGYHLLLRFEGIAFPGKVRLNDTMVGPLDPWVPYAFDVTGMVHSGLNDIEVDLDNADMPINPATAGHARGGIVRDIFLEMRPDVYIANAHLRCQLSPALDFALCGLKTNLKSSHTAVGHMTVDILAGGLSVSEMQRGFTMLNDEAAVGLAWRVNAPALWSPDKPVLYTLRVRLERGNGDEIETYQTEIGFRKIEIFDNRFYLNNQRLALRGMCLTEQGHLMTSAQIEQDMRRIKSRGANFVRLGPYSHDPEELEIAARLGLLVTEESGLASIDFQNITHETLKTEMEDFERVIGRDWNNPSLFGVVLANQSTPAAAMQETSGHVRNLAPDLLVGSALPLGLARNDEGPRRLFTKGILDFIIDDNCDDDKRVFEVINNVPE